MRLSLPKTLSLALVLSASGFASASTIDFTGLTGVSGETFSSFTENGYTVAATTGSILEAIQPVGNGFIGDPLPSIYTADGTVTVTKVGGGSFDFDGVDFANYSGPKGTYTIKGYSGSTLDYSLSGTVTGAPGVFDAYGLTETSVSVTSVVIGVIDRDTDNIDNIVLSAPVSATPEPSSLMLLGTGILGLAGAARRRLA